MLIRTLHGLPLIVRWLTYIQFMANPILKIFSIHTSTPEICFISTVFGPYENRWPLQGQSFAEKGSPMRNKMGTQTHTQSGLVVPHGSVVSRYIHYWSHRLVSPVSLCVCISTLLSHSKYHYDQNVRHYRNKTYRSLLFDNTLVMHGILSILSIGWRRQGRQETKARGKRQESF